MPELMNTICYIVPAIVWRAYEKGHPPPFGERQEPSTLIIFRTKNPEKSRLGLIGKISEKICGKMFRAKGKAPNLVERGRGVLKYGRLDAEIVELFGIARG